MVGGSLHILRVAVGEPELGKDGVHLSCIAACDTEYVENLALRVLLLVVPRGDACHSLVAGLAVAQLGAGNDDVSGKKLRVGHQHTVLFLHAQCAYECLLLLLDDLHNLSLRLDATAPGGNDHAHFVAVERVHGVAFSHKDALAVLIGHHAVLAVAAAHEGAGGHIAALRCLVLAGRYLDQVAVEGKFGEHQRYRAVCGGGVGFYGVCHLLIVECVVFLLAYELHYFVAQFLG